MDAAPVPAAEDDAVDRAREVSQALALDPGCHEDMGDGPCGVEPVAARIDPGTGQAYPVCVEHVRDDMVPLAALDAAGVPVVPDSTDLREPLRKIVREHTIRDRHYSDGMFAAGCWGCPWTGDGSGHTEHLADLLVAAVRPDGVSAEREALREQVRRVFADPKYGHDVEWVRINVMGAIARTDSPSGGA